MTPERTTFEAIAPTVNEAIQKGLDELGLTQDDVQIEVLDGGSRGLLGFGSRQARVRLTVKAAESFAELLEQEEEAESVEMEEQAESDSPRAAEEPADETLATAKRVVEDLLSKMKVRATVSAAYMETDEVDDDDRIMVSIEGKDLSILIGRHTETLNALQYISSTIISKQLNRWVGLSIDVQGYRMRREKQLRILARRTAEQVIKTGRKQVLEPMTASERRVIHMELRNNPDVSTESTGEDPNRKVTIFIKR